MKIIALFTLLTVTATAYGGTVSGTLLAPSGLPIKNGTLTFNLQQAGLMVGSGSVVPTSASCYTSADGSMVGVPNPLSLPITAISYGSGTLPAGIYYVEYAFSIGSLTTLVSPELQVQLTSAGSLTFSPPATFPAAATGMTVYMGAASGAELAQGQSVGSTGTYVQYSPLVNNGALPAVNNTVCSIAFNDTIIPYSGYNVSLLSSNGNAYPGWPQAWQLNGGAAGIVNISNGAPLWNGTIIYPQPIMAQPLNHGPQSISGLLNMTGYNLVNAGMIGVGTTTPSFGIDVEGSYISSGMGYLYQGGGGTTGQCLVSNGTAFIPGSCTPSGPSIFYQHVQANGSLQAQEPYLNFNNTLSVQDNPGGTRTDIGLPLSGVTAGSYTNANITVDALGRVTSAANGSGSATQIQTLGITSGICTTANTSYATCTAGPYSWPVSFSNLNYIINCSLYAPTTSTGGAVPVLSYYVYSQTASQFTLILQNGSSNGTGANTTSAINCIGIHP